MSRSIVPELSFFERHIVQMKQISEETLNITKDFIYETKKLKENFEYKMQLVTSRLYECEQQKSNLRHSCYDNTFNTTMEEMLELEKQYRILIGYLDRLNSCKDTIFEIEQLANQLASQSVELSNKIQSSNNIIVQTVEYYSQAK